MSNSFLSDRIKKLKPSATLALAAKATELKQQGKDVISLSLGEPDWPSFQKITNEAKKALDSNKTKYTPSSGIKSLKLEIAKNYNSSFSTQYTDANVSVTGGAKFSIFAAMQALLNPGDEVIIPAPYWVSYPSMVELCEALPVCVACGDEDQFKLSAKNLEKHITAKTKMLILNSPSNPTGMAYNKSELLAIAEVLRKHSHIILLSDDIYNRLVFDSQKISPHILQLAPDLIDRCVSINGVSKTFSMTGWRLGWALGPKAIIDAMTNYQSQSISCAASFVQEATVPHLNSSEPEIAHVITDLSARMQKSYDLILQVPKLKLSKPDGAFYLWVDLRAYISNAQVAKSYLGKKIQGSADFCLFLLEDYSVACVPGVEFGLDGFMRISYVVSETEFAAAIQRIQKFVAQIQ